MEFLLVMAAAMLGAFLYAETRAVEPLIPLVLFRNPVISMCSVASFILGMGMFAVIIYLPLFMQGVLGVSATRIGHAADAAAVVVSRGKYPDRPDESAHEDV